jgi:hypothetical protein
MFWAIINRETLRAPETAPLSGIERLQRASDLIAHVAQPTTDRALAAELAELRDRLDRIADDQSW